MASSRPEGEAARATSPTRRGTLQPKDNIGINAAQITDLLNMEWRFIGLCGFEAAATYSAFRSL
jgi:hypothetical protein